MISKSVQIYVKTTETCNLNCSHCFTSGSNGRKIFFKPRETFFFIRDLVESFQIENLRIVYHGGEPMLAPIRDLEEFQMMCETLDTQVSYGMQTNLAYHLNESKLNFINNTFKDYGLGTSWDYKIRFGSTSANPNVGKRIERMWEDNVMKLADQGHSLSLMVSLSKDLIRDISPYKIINYASTLGFKYILFERITGDGNALTNPEVFPKNKEVDSWLLRMFEETMEYKLYNDIGNMFLNEIANSFSRKKHIANRCRNCEQSLITINADGTMSGCPNSAPNKIWGNIFQKPNEVLSSPVRVSAVCKEMSRNPVCHTCPVNDVCNGDCYKLPWEGDICAAPKSLMSYIKENKDLQNKMDLLLLD